jgi:hypothetical protein
LHTNPTRAKAPASSSTAPPSAEATPRLTKAEVVDLADGEARSRGVTGQYRHTDPEFNARDGIWSMFYEEVAVAGAEEQPKRFSVMIDDKTKGRVFVPGK